ncbi:Spermidine/putrescine transport system permease protein PotB [Clostridium sp. N3C]|uniref:ABC transporter permease n=1 Tax=Clostridium sp. N3C TaxID=1776758 RepID=UPI00092E197F|nr:ABC transporter permease [Clostridium sp. N3C]SCN25245.1 Spermidine/putrescine transport system permease protein PotB [Clostridium sp. N3C]
MNTEVKNMEPPPGGKERSKFSSKLRGSLLTIAPITLWMLAFFIVPIIIIIVISFSKRTIVGSIEYSFNLSNYGKVFNLNYVKILGNSLWISLETTLLCLLFGYPFAYFVARASKKYRSILLMLIILPFWTNSLIRTYAWMILLRTEGIINTYLMNLHIIKEPLQMLYTEGAVLIGMLYTMFPFMVLPLYSTIEKLDFSLLEVAADLGANPRKTFLKVTLPLTKSGILSGCLLVFVPTLGLFFIPDLMGGSKIILISNLIKNQFLQSRNWPFGAAMSIIVMLLMFIFLKLFNKLGGSKDKLEVM